MEEESEKTYQNIIKFCRVTQTSYFDYSFPPDDGSIGEIVADGANGKLDVPIGVVNLYWLRPHEIEDSDDEDDDDSEWSIMNNPKSSDVVQSSVIGNCTIISAMATIAERPDILNNIFPSKEISPEGVYRVRLYINGEWKTILVDDYFPCYMHSGKMATAIGKRKQLWVPLIEKAYAKVFGSYSVLAEGSSLRLPLSILTGSCCTHHRVPDDPDEVDLFWNVLMSSHLSGFLICCSSHREEYCVRDRKVAENHGFSILTLNDEHQNRLLRLRNPWGHTKWTGKWSKDWDGWPSSMKDKLLIDEDEDNGIFWMELDDFMDMFQGVAIAKFHPNWHEIREELTIGLDTPTIKFTVTEACEASFSAVLKIPESMQKIDIILSVHRISQNNIIGELIGRSERDFGSSTFSEEFLFKPGEYIIMLFNLENMNKINIPRIVICYSSKPIFHEFISQNPQMINHALREIVLKDGKLRTDTPYGTFYRSLTREFGGRLVMVDNYHNNKYFQLKYETLNNTNLKSSRGSSLTMDVIPPRSYQIIDIFSPIDFAGKTELTQNEKLVLSSFEECISADLTDDQSIISQKIQHYPVIDSLDPIHYPQSIYYDSAPKIDEILTEKKKCRQRIKHFLWLCDCRG